VVTATASTSDLAARLDRALAEAEALARAMPDERVATAVPGRARTLGGLAFHVFRTSLAFADAMDTGGLPREWLTDQPPEDLADGPAIGRYGALVRGRLAGWFEGAGAGEYVRTIDTCRGPATGLELLAHTVAHAERHLGELRRHGA
jgi:uncharacterized damage-inducible protein DinB